jgi:hypothetical protein
MPLKKVAAEGVSGFNPGFEAVELRWWRFLQPWIRKPLPDASSTIALGKGAGIYARRNQGRDRKQSLR